MTELKKSTRSMADIIGNNLVLGNDGSITAEGNWFEKTLEGTGLTTEDIVKAQRHLTNASLGLEVAFGEKAVEAFKNDKELGVATLVVEMGQDQVEVNVRRHVPTPKENDTKNDRFAVSNLAYRVQGVEDSGAERKKIRKHLHEMAASVLG